MPAGPKPNESTDSLLKNYESRFALNEGIVQNVKEKISQLLNLVDTF